MESDSNSMEQKVPKDLTEDIKDYLNLRMQIMRLNVTEKISVALAGAITGTIVIVLYLLVLLCITIAFALWLGTFFNNMIIGFLCVGGIYLIIAVLIRRISQRSFKSKLTDKFIADFSNDD